MERDSNGRKAGKGALVQEELSGTPGVSQDQTLIQTAIGFTNRGYPSGNIAETMRSDPHGAYPMVACVDVYNQTIEGDIAPTVTAAVGGSNTSGPKVMAYGIGSYASNAMLSDNPHSGIYEADTSRTLDLNGGNPACHQGGMAIVQADGFGETGQGYWQPGIQTLRAEGENRPSRPSNVVVYPMEGNGARPSHFGTGFGADGDPEFTLNHVEVHGAAVVNDGDGH